jgi:uncharacterized membrane protein HdeD (DUF308 family)
MQRGEADSEVNEKGGTGMSANVFEAVIAIVAGILVLAVPQFLIWFVGVYLIVIGVVKLTRGTR